MNATDAHAAGAVPRIDAAALMRWLRLTEEVALLDVREPGEFGRGHLLLATNAPASQLELILPRLVPCPAAPIVLCADIEADDPRLERCADTVRRLGYEDVMVLSGRATDWQAAGFQIFTGFNVPSKAFGEWLEREAHTPSIDARTLHAQLGRGDLLVVDCRPADEHRRGAVPGAINLPGVEIALRLPSVLPDRRTPVVVHCAGRTRGIVAAQSLIDLGLPNPVQVLRNGLIGWELADLTTAPPQHPDAALPPPATRPPASTEGDGLPALLHRRADALARDHGVQRIDAEEFRALQRQAAERTLYCFDVRTQAEHQAGHLPGFLHVPGGQLVQSLDDHVAVRGSRIVLADDRGLRALLVGALLRQMGWEDVFVLVGDDAAGPGNDDRSDPASPAVASPALPLQARPQTVDATTLARRPRGESMIIDLGNSRRYRQGHIAGAWFAIRALLHRYADRLGEARTITLVCDDGRISTLAAGEFADRLRVPVDVLEGGMQAWHAARLPLEQTPRTLCEYIDVPTNPYDYEGDIRQQLQAYIDWELELVDKVQAENCLRFRR
ncbi:MAG TPA: rhodanese-like domain-containing protein [Burkholderiaceae bacterium]|nr:rhodanese-like domain-containing protein [Burkholderiaceae bacterium]